MKKILIVTAFLASITSAQADEVFLVNNTAGAESWYGYPQTLSKITDAYSVLVARRFNDGQKPDERMFAAASFVDCRKGYGSVYTRADEKDAWRIATNFSAEANKTVGDVIAANICNAGKELEKSFKPVLKKQTSKSI